MTRDCLNFLLSFMSPTKTYLEYGGGSSSLYFAKRVKAIRTVEHVSAFALDIVKRAKQIGLKNIWVRHVPRDKSIAPSERRGL